MSKSLVPPPVELWPSVVDGPALADDLRAAFERYLTLPPDASIALVLWTIHTHAYLAADHFPILAVLSPQKRCGKTTLLRLLEAVARQAVHLVHVSMAALFRMIEESRPTLLIDEADMFLAGAELIGILNSGHSIGGQVVRTAGDDYKPTGFSTWSPKAIASIGTLPETLVDRSIVIPLRRRSREGSSQPRLSTAALEELRPLGSRISRWVTDNFELLRQSEPAIPSELDDRQADNWRPLFAIADAVGEPWSMASRQLAVSLGQTGFHDQSPGEMVLEDLRQIFLAHGATRLHTITILRDLNAMKERPWSALHGGGIRDRSLARLLTPFGIEPERLRIGPLNLRGYVLNQVMIEAFDSYLGESPEQPEHPEQNDTVPHVPAVPHARKGGPRTINMQTGRFNK